MAYTRGIRVAYRGWTNFAVHSTVKVLGHLRASRWPRWNPVKTWDRYLKGKVMEATWSWYNCVCAKNRVCSIFLGIYRTDKWFKSKIVIPLTFNEHGCSSIPSFWVCVFILQRYDGRETVLSLWFCSCAGNTASLYEQGSHEIQWWRARIGSA